MVNMQKLKGKMAEAGYTVDEMAGLISVSRQTLNRKLNHDGTKITIREANELSNALNLSIFELLDIFFPERKPKKITS